MFSNSVTALPAVVISRQDLMTAYFVRARATFLHAVVTLAGAYVQCFIVYLTLADPQRSLLHTESSKVMLGSIGLVLLGFSLWTLFLKGPSSPIASEGLQSLPKKAGALGRAINWLGLIVGLWIIFAGFVDTGMMNFSGASIWIAIVVMSATTMMSTLFQGLAELDFALKYQAESGER